MARPSFDTIAATAEQWDAVVDANFDLIGATPVPIAVYANLAALPAASAYDDCLAVLADVDRLVVSDNANWRVVPTEAATVANLVDNSTGTSGGNTIAAVTSIATAADAVATLAAKINQILTSLKNADAIA